MFLGQLYEETARSALAEAAYRSALQQWPSPQSARIALGRLLLAQGREEEAWTFLSPLLARSTSSNVALDPTGLYEEGVTSWTRPAQLRALRDRLYRGITSRLTETYVNGSMEHRLPGNLNISFAFVEGESLLMALKDVAVSSGSACTSASLEPSYVLRALGVGDELAHTSIRFGLGRFNTEAEVDYVIELVVKSVERLRTLSPLWEMHQDGIDLNSIQWTPH